MQILVNNEPMEFNGTAVQDLVEQLGLPASGVAVAIGMDIVPKAEWGTRQIADGDKVMIIKAASGG